jgi:BirA family biotin operon repressor/biotin-[acetyl-CoA-carboxylase] ligase
MSDPEFTIHRFEAIDSTNTFLVSEAQKGAPDKTVVVAAHQTAGRGRRGRTWEAPPGSSLLASVLLRLRLPDDQLMLATVAVALAARAALASLTGSAPELKWPNDLLYGEKKVSGVLAELASVDEAEQAIVIGIGINLTWPGPDGVNATSVADETGISLSPEQLLSELLLELSTRASLLENEHGRKDLQEEFAHHLATIGTLVKVELADGVLTGLAQGVNQAGHLILETSEGQQIVMTGDVIHLRST